MSDEVSDGELAAAQTRDGRSTDTRERILRVTEQLYLAGGYEHINLHVIAERLGVSKTALFHHFKNKQELFYATLLYMLARYNALFAEALDVPDERTRERLRRIMRGLTRQEPFDMTRFTREEYGLLSLEQRAEVERAWRAGMFDAVRRVLDEGVRAGELRAIDLSFSTYVFMHLCMLLPRASNPLPQPLTAPRDEAATDRAVDALLEVYLNGIGLQPTGQDDTGGLR